MSHKPNALLRLLFSLSSLRRTALEVAGAGNKELGAGGSVLGGLLATPGFFTKEAGAPLLRRNAKYLAAADDGTVAWPDGLRARHESWPVRCGAPGASDVASGV